MTTSSQINFSHSLETFIILGITYYTRKLYRVIKLFIGLVGISILFPLYLISIPFLVILLKISISRAKRILVKVDLAEVPANYEYFHHAFYELQEILDKISDENGNLNLPKKYNSWYIKPIMNELIKYHLLLYNFRKKLNKELFFDLNELGLTEEEIKEARSRLESFKEDWGDEKDWKSFEIKYNKYALQE